MKNPIPNYRLQPFAKFLLWSMVVGAVVEYCFFCVTTGIPLIWTAVGLLCWAVLLLCSREGLRRVEVFLTDRLSRRLGAEERRDA
jgi:hypothetical protein